MQLFRHYIYYTIPSYQALTDNGNITGGQDSHCHWRWQRQVSLNLTYLPNVRTLTYDSGINFAFAKSLLSKRCNVVFADLALRPEAQEIVSNHASPSQSPARAVFQHTDVREWQHLERMFHVATKEFGGADIVCPGAGVFEPVPPPSPILHLFPHSNNPISPSPTSGTPPAPPNPTTHQPPTATPSST